MTRQVDCPAIERALGDAVADVVYGTRDLPVETDGASPEVSVDVHGASLIVTAAISVDRGRDVPRTTRDVCDAIRNRLYEFAPGEVPVVRVRIGYIKQKQPRWDLLHRASPEGRPHHWMPGAQLRKKGTPVMSGTDKIKHTAEDLKGRAKEAVGKATDNDKLAAEGKVDQAKAKVGKAADKAKDAVKDVLDE